MSKRFTDGGEGLARFAHRFLVRCPRCQHKALVRPVGYHRAGSPYWVSEVLLTCTSCGYSKWRKMDGRTMLIGGPWDWYFHEPLWLQRPCCGETLWAYNEEHLAFIERFVAADLRERVPNKNTSLASRLPRWMKLARNRDEVLVAVEKLKSLL